MLRRTGKKVILLVNKIDNPSKIPDSFYDFYTLGNRGADSGFLGE
jgi:GTP-binding protein